jgi:hypothetical protein
MIDTFALALSHGLILLAAWRLVQRPDLDDDDARTLAEPGAKKSWRPFGRDDAGA